MCADYVGPVGVIGWAITEIWSHKLLETFYYKHDDSLSMRQSFGIFPLH